MLTKINFKEKIAYLSLFEGLHDDEGHNQGDDPISQEEAPNLDHILVEKVLEQKIKPKKAHKRSPEIHPNILTPTTPLKLIKFIAQLRSLHLGINLCHDGNNPLTQSAVHSGREVESQVQNQKIIQIHLLCKIGNQATDQLGDRAEDDVGLEPVAEERNQVRNQPPERLEDEREGFGEQNEVVERRVDVLLVVLRDDIAESAAHEG